MAKLDFSRDNSKFELEVGEDVYVGILNDLTKAQEAKQNKILKPLKEENEHIGGLFNKMERLETKLRTKKNLGLWEDVDKIEDQIFSIQDEIKSRKEELNKNTDLEQMFKSRLEMSIDSPDKEEILLAGKDHGYENVFNTILKDIKERQTKK